MRRRADRLVPILIGFAVLAIGFPLLDDYHVTWDEALGDFFFGERYLSFFTSFDQTYLDFAADPYPADRVPDLRSSSFRNRPWEYYPVANTLAAACSTVLSRWLGLLDPFDGYHALGLLLLALMAGVLYSWMRREFDTLAAVSAVVVLVSSPRVVVHALSNVKDVPEMVFFALALLLFHRAWQDGSRRGLLGAGLVWGLALGTKANALFLPPVVLAVVLAAGTPEPWRRRRTALWTTLFAGAALGLLLTFAGWPYLWPAPIERIGRHLEYIGLRLFATRAESLASPLAALLGTTPLPYLVLVLVGFALAVRRLPRREARWLLPLAWVVVVLGRLYLPNAVNFDGVRHFLELMPALAILAGAAASWAHRRVVASVSPPLGEWLATGLITVVLLAGPAAVATSHPFQLAYWNRLFGGLAGARASRQAQAGDYWGTSYRQGLEWLSRHVPQNSALAVPILQHTVRLTVGQRLRSDIGLIDITRPDRPELRPGALRILSEVARERPVYVLYVLRDDWTNELIDDCERRLRPVVHWDLQGQRVLAIYRWRPPVVGIG